MQMAIAPSGQRTCDSCKTKIPKGAIHVNARGWNLSQNLCLTCVEAEIKELKKKGGTCPQT